MRYFGMLRLSAMVLIVIVASACGGDDDSDLIDAGSFTVTNQDDADHAHELTIDCADIGSEVPVSYTATGPHEHTVTLTADDLTRIGAGETVTVSFTDGHDHIFQIAKPAAAH